MEDFSRKLPIGVQSFKVMREEGFLYVDKTELVYKLAHSGRVNFLSRPRRFGKSLFLSTLEAYFLGKKDLFNGLYIEEKENSSKNPWQEYPVFYFDFNVGRYDSDVSLDERINFLLSKIENKYGINVPELSSFGSRFEFAIKRAYEKTGKHVVVLIDEYDKPLLSSMDMPELNESYRKSLKAFYSVLKSADQYLRFAFLTGVTKFSKVSIFSDLNNLRDISMEEGFASICGITQEELEKDFAPEIKSLSKKNKCSVKEILDCLKKQYDGYRFHPNGLDLYNPFSLLNSFAKQEIGYYWFETGTPTFLVKFLKRVNYNLPDLDGNVEMGEFGLVDYRVDSSSPIPILFQAGYLTIKGYDEMFRIYKLGFPNDEVRYGFMYNLFPEYTNINFNDSAFCVVSFTRDVMAGRVDEFMQRLKSIMASLPYDNVKKDTNESLALKEHNYQMAIYLVFKLMGRFVQTEIASGKGRSDCVVETEKYIYIFEFKLKATAEEALQQIQKRKYAEQYKAHNKKIILIGVSFDAEERTVGEWIYEEERNKNR